MAQNQDDCIAKCIRIALFGSALMVLPALYALGYIAV